MGWLARAGLGSLIGMRHALEPDHLAAVSTLVTGERSSAKAAWLGACWGLGHTLTLLAAGAVLVVWRAEMPGGAAEAFELGVVLLLVGFGVRAIHQGVYRGPTRARRTPTPPRPRAGCGARWVDGRAGHCSSAPCTGWPAAARSPRWSSRTAVDPHPAQLPGAVRHRHDRGHGGALGAGRVAARPLAAHPWIAHGLSVAVGGVSIVLGLVWGYPLVASWF